MSGDVPQTAMIMAAGLGTRMRPLTLDRPKPLVAVAGAALIDHLLAKLAAAGIARVVVNVHYLADKLEAHLARASFGLQVAVSDEREQLLETGGGLVRALPLIDADPFVQVNSDNLWTDGMRNPFARLAQAWDDRRMDALLLLVPLGRAHGHRGRGDFDLASDGRIARRTPDSQRPLVWTGIQMLSKRLIVNPPASVFSTNIFWDRAVAAGRAFGVEHDGEWFDIGRPEAIPEADKWFARAGVTHG